MTQCNVSNISLSSNKNAEDVALFIKECGDLGSELVAHLGDLESAKNALENNYHGEHYSELYFSMELFDECYINEIPENLRRYFSYEAFSDDLFSCDYYSIKVNGKTHVFSNN